MHIWLLNDCTHDITYLCAHIIYVLHHIKHFKTLEECINTPEKMFNPFKAQDVDIYQPHMKKQQL